MWEKMHFLPAKANIDSRTKIFQFKVSNNILHLNKTLHKMGKVQSPLFSLCKESNETASHLFLNIRDQQHYGKVYRYTVHRLKHYQILVR